MHGVLLTLCSSAYQQPLDVRIPVNEGIFLHARNRHFETSHISLAFQKPFVIAIRREKSLCAR